MRLKGVFEGERVYLFGPMSSFGIKGQYNFPAFEDAALMIEALGGQPVCPARMDKAVWGFDGRGEMPQGMCLRTVIPIDLTVILTCTMGYGLRDWENSSGAMPELALMRCLQFPIEFQPGAFVGTVGAVPLPEVQDE